MTLSRRALLRRTAGVGVGLGAAGTVGAQEGTEEETELRRVIVPRVREFEDNYAGQWVELKDETDADTDVVEECEFATWSSEETAAYDGLLLDRRSEAPVAVRLTALTNEAWTESPDAESVFIVNSAEPCTSSHMGLGLEAVPMRAVVGKPAGPAAPTTEAPGPGLGLLQGGTGLVAGLLAWRYGRSRSTDEDSTSV